MPEPSDDIVAAYFAISDLFRRVQANALGVVGLGPRECQYQVIKSRSFWRLRDYSGPDAAPPLLVVAAPIKRPYIWDLAPAVSVLRYCLRHGLHVYLLEWMPPVEADAQAGLDEYVGEAIADCVTTIANAEHRLRPVLAGHSLGGTLAATYCALEPNRASGLVLLSAPLCFEPGSSGFRDSLVALARTPLSESNVTAGSLLTHISAAVSPGTFFWSRWKDAALSVADPSAVEIHARVERWSLDEMALSSKLLNQIFHWLYDENRLCRGLLPILGRTVGPSRQNPPILAVINTLDEIAPLASVAPFIVKSPDKDSRIIEYPGEVGVVLQHLGVLLGRQAHASLWPQIVAWIKSRA